MRFPRLMLAAAGLATVALLGSSAAANAATAAGTVNGPFFNAGEAGYQIQSSTTFNEVRTTVHVTPGSSTSDFVALQQNVNGGQTFAIGLLNVNNQVFLVGTKGFTFNTQTGVPLGPTIKPRLEFLASVGAPAGDPLFSATDGGSYFIEVHYSTSQHLAQYVAGPSETDAATLATTGPTFHVKKSITFNAPAVETINFGGGTLPTSAPQASFTRTGVTEPAGSNVGGVAGTRVTFDFFATNEVEATENGDAPSINNLVTLMPSPALPGVGSAFGIITGS